MKKCITINIEASEIRYMVADKHSVTQWGSVALPSGTIDKGMIVNPSAVSKALDKIATQVPLKKLKLIAGVNGVQSVHRIIDLPRMSARLRDEAMVIKAEQVVPVSLELLHLCHHTLKSNRSEDSILLLGVPHNILDAKMECLKKAKAVPEQLFLKPMALLGIVEQSEAITVDVEPENFTILAVAGGVPIIARTNVIASDCSPEERSQLIINELESTLAFYESSSSDSATGKPVSIFLTGKAASEENLAEVIQASTGYPVEPLNLDCDYPPDIPLAQFAINLGLAKAVGCAARKKVSAFARPEGMSRKKYAMSLGPMLYQKLRHLKRTKPPLITHLDILPEAYRHRRLPGRRLVLAGGALVAIALLVPLSFTVKSTADDNDVLARENTGLEEAMSLRQAEDLITQTQLREVDQSLSLVEAQREELLQIQISFDEVYDSRFHMYKSIRKAMDLMPLNMRLSSIDYVGNGVNLEGNVFNSINGSETYFIISFDIIEGAPPDSSFGDLETIGSGDSFYKGYGTVLTYADTLRERSEWFSNVQVQIVAIESSTD